MYTYKIPLKHVKPISVPRMKTISVVITAVQCREILFITTCYLIKIAVTAVRTCEAHISNIFNPISFPNRLYSDANQNENGLERRD